MELSYLAEPQLKFGNNQTAIDPRDGLSLFGPYESISPYSLRIGIIGEKSSLEKYKKFVRTLNSPILTNSIERPSYHGFQAIFNVSWPAEPIYFKEIDSNLISRSLNKKNLSERVYEVVSLYYDGMQKTMQKEDVKIDVWFVIVPKSVWQNCRPLSKSTDKEIPLSIVNAHEHGQSFLWGEEEQIAEHYSEILDTKNDFHDSLKASVVDGKIITPIQIIIDTTLEFRNKYNGREYDLKMKAHLAWTQATTLYYKMGCLPWKLKGIRKGVCYLGMVYKRYQRKKVENYACSAAQMFLDSGDGTVFRGNPGRYFNPDTREYHLDTENAKKFCLAAMKDYKSKLGYYPDELFIHGRAKFKNDEWKGFIQAIKCLKAQTKIAGIIIKPTNKLKLIKNTKETACKYGVMRGYYHLVDKKDGFLWTRGFIPSIQSSNSLEIPNPLRIKIDKGQVDIETAIKDIMCLTKLNYNACLLGDGLPVTLRFSDQIGDILTAADESENRPLSFKYYV